MLGDPSTFGDLFHSSHLSQTFVATGRRFIKDKEALVDATFEPTFDWASQNVEIKGSLSTANEYDFTACFEPSSGLIPDRLR